MTSELDALYAWIHLPGHTEPVVCGQFRRSRAAGSDVGTFVYGKSYLARPDAVAIDPVALPLKEQRFSTPYLTGWFSVLLDAGPDEWGKRLIDRLHGPQDTAGYLLRARGQPVGALSFSMDASVMPSNHATTPGIARLDQLMDLHRAIEAGDEVAEHDRELLMQGTSAGGARPKTTVAYDDSLWLAKFPSTKDSPDQPAVPIMEGALLSVAQACDIRVPNHRLIMVAGAPVLLVERFDRQRLADGSFARIRYASARTVLWSNPEAQKYSYMGSYTGLVRQMRLWERAPSKDIRELYRRIAFNCLVGNTDDHDCNTGFLAYEEDFFSLSPAFDITARPATPRMFLAMGFGTEGAAVTLGNLLSESELFGYRRMEAEDIIHSQWETITASVVGHMVSNGAPERVAAKALLQMPGNRFFD